jgi:hypothetical protein
MVPSGRNGSREEGRREDPSGRDAEEGTREA